MNKVKILLIEDEWILATELAQELRANGYDVGEAVASAKEAKTALMHGNYDLALIDVGLKDEEDGISVAHFVNQKIKIPFIFCYFIN